MVVVFVDAEKCDGCGTCVEICPVEAFKFRDDKTVVVNPDECFVCLVCEEMCPNHAIEVVD